MKKWFPVLFFTGLVGVFLLCHFSGLYRAITVDSIRDYILSFGMLAPIIYILMFTFVPLTLFPDSVLAIAGGVVFGLVWGTIYTMIGAVCGGTLAFYISRYFGRGIVEKLIRHKANWFEEGVEKRGFLLILILRLIPLVPYDIISYGAGLSKIKYKDFITGTSLGIIPGVLVFSNLGDKAANFHSWDFACAVLALIGLFAVSYFAKKKLDLKALQEKMTVYEAEQGEA